MSQKVKHINLRIVDIIANAGETVNFDDDAGPIPVPPTYQMVVELGEGCYRPVDIPAETFTELATFSNGG